MEIFAKKKKLEHMKHILEHEVEITNLSKKILEHRLEISKIHSEINKLDITINTNILEKNDSDIIVVNKYVNNEKKPLNTYINANDESHLIDLEYRYQLEEFVKVKIGEYSFDRMIKHNNNCGFRKFYSFLKHNNKQIKANSNDDTDFILRLANKLNRSSIKMADSEHRTVWDATAFYYNKKGELCIMHPR